MARKNNSQNQFSRFLGFAVGLAKNMAHSPEGVSRLELTNNAFEAQGGIFRALLEWGSPAFTFKGSPNNPFGLTLTSSSTGTGAYLLTFEGIPPWINVGVSSAIVRVEVLSNDPTNFLIAKLDYPYSSGADIGSASTGSIAFKTIDPAVSPGTAVDLEDTDVIYVEIIIP